VVERERGEKGRERKRERGRERKGWQRLVSSQLEHGSHGSEWRCLRNLDHLHHTQMCDGGLITKEDFENDKSGILASL
jgi:hypothetical protein